MSHVDKLGRSCRIYATKSYKVKVFHLIALSRVHWNFLSHGKTVLYLSHDSYSLYVNTKYPLEVSSSIHLREFFHAIVRSGLLLRDLNL